MLNTSTLDKAKARRAAITHQAAAALAYRETRRRAFEEAAAKTKLEMAKVDLSLEHKLRVPKQLQVYATRQAAANVATTKAAQRSSTGGAGPAAQGPNAVSIMGGPTGATGGATGLAGLEGNMLGGSKRGVLVHVPKLHDAPGVAAAAPAPPSSPAATMPNSPRNQPLYDHGVKRNVVKKPEVSSQEVTKKLVEERAAEATIATAVDEARAKVQAARKRMEKEANAVAQDLMSQETQAAGRVDGDLAKKKGAETDLLQAEVALKVQTVRAVKAAAEKDVLDAKTKGRTGSMQAATGGA